jgi:glycosyltransferase involved in cell wall biosynthesis
VKTKITHLTSVHVRYDTRIFLKMCRSLAKNENFTVSLIVADGKGNELKDGVNIIDAGARTGGRISRMTKTVNRVFELAKVQNSNIYHLHDPELLPVGLKLKKLGFKVIFDAHEDLPKQLLGKPYLNKPAKILLSKAFEIYESFVCKRLDYVLTATPFIRDKFLKINAHSLDINNFPILGELANRTAWSEKKEEICYVGGISQIRGIKEVVKALEFTKNVKLNLVGAFSEKALGNEVRNYAGWANVNEIGYLGRNEVAEVMSHSKAGLVTFHPMPNHIDAQPNKMFEYMSSGLPIITSDFPLWKEIVEGNNCGICVNPLKPEEIADAIDFILAHPEKAEMMGKNGQEAVEKKYNWAVEEKKLVNVYKGLMK